MRRLSACPDGSLKYAIFIDEGFRARPGFLRYFGQTLSLLDQDDSVFSVSAWNHNGFEGLSQDPSLVYRTEDFPATGWVVRRSVWESEVRGKEAACCMVFPWHSWFGGDHCHCNHVLFICSPWHSWFGGDLKGREVLVPDVSRVEYIVREGLFEDDAFRQDYFPGRSSNSEPVQDVSDVQKLSRDVYEEEVKRLISSSTPLQPSQFSTCLTQQEHFAGPAEKGFTYGGNQYLLVGSQSPYYSQKPPDFPAIRGDTAGIV
uniref:Alpha-1,3-mannosyl-glycoprotein 2-beta-N-acetylglucosaminyltransferase n=1 Tax=Branchiostoma floridae TaxID=7739 RepID=C3ZWL5_BRAFL|eukprot:XP_002587073.1 hypothetical protein BRAFLDRAFT_102994 [Branchiostoma floridae]